MEGANWSLVSATVWLNRGSLQPGTWLGPKKWG